MANAVAGLAVLLGLDATEYTRGLTKAEYQAKKFAQNTRSAILEVGKVLGGLEIARQVYESTKAIIAEAAALNDLAAATGSSVESLSRLNNQVRTSGGDIKSMNDAVLKLAASMGGTDKQSLRVQETLKQLGITTKDPVEALQQLALKLNTYADGVNKVALAQAVFKGTGREFLKTLQDIAELQDVQATVTAKQAQEAENLEKAIFRLSAESRQFANVILNTVGPGMADLLAQFSDGIRIAGGFWEALNRFSTLQSPSNIADTIKAIDSLNIAIAQTRANAAHPILGKLQIGDPAKAIAAFEQQREFLSRSLARQQRADEALRRQESRGFDPRQQAPKPPPTGGGGGAKKLKEQTTEAQRYLETLEKQNERALELTHTEQFLRDVQMDRIKGLNPALTEQILEQVQLLDLAEAAKKTEKESKKLAEEEMKIREETSKLRQKGIKELQDETLDLAKKNEEMAYEISLIGKDAIDLARLEQKRLDNAIAMKQEKLAMEINAAGYTEEAKAIEDHIRLLKDRKGIVAQRGVAEQIEADLAKAKEINDLFADSFADAAKSIIKNTDSIAGAFKKMGQRISDALLDMALDNIAKSLFGAPTSSGGGGIFGGIGAAIMGSIFGGGSSSGYGMNVRASGGPVAANQPYVVGERGPELFMPKTAGTIIPNSQTGRGNFVFNINVPAGATRSTIEQTQLKFGMALQSVMDRNG